MTLTTPYKNFRKRLLNEYSTTLLFIPGVALYCYATDRDFTRTLIFISPVLVIGVMLAVTKAWHIVYGVHFTETTIKITGATRDSQWEKEFDIKNSTIEIRSKSKSRGRVIYYLRIKSGDRSQDINRTFNWDYAALLSIFHEFKRIKGEKIIHDEQYYLTIIERKSKGLSSGLFDVDWNWKSK